MTQSFSCPACGAPNDPEAGLSHMTCAYCGVNLTIPDHLRTKAFPKAEQTSSKAKTVTSPEMDAADLLRKAQPVAIRAWNLFSLWTWVRWILPTCLGIIVILFILCAVLGAIPFVLRLFR